MRRCVFALILAASVSLPPLTAHAAPKDRLVFFGTHGVSASDVPAGQPIPDHGIYAARFNETTGALTPLGLAVALERPTWIIADPKKPVLYAVNELGNDGKSHGAVISLTPDGSDGKLKILNQVDSQGGGATHLTLDGQTLYVANYGTGQVASFPVNADGTVGDATSVQQDTGSGPSPRQKGPHAHGVTVDPSHHYLLAADLGADRVFIYKIDPVTRTLSPADPAFEQLPPGTGPRHVLFGHSGKYAYVLSELTSELRTYGWDTAKGHLTLLSTQSTLPDSYDGKKSGGDIEIAKTGHFLYVSNRGEDAVLAYALDAKTGQAKEIQSLPAQGTQPWHMSFDLTGKWLLVADESSSNVAVFKVDMKTGKLTATASTISLPKPVNVVFLP